MKLTNKELIEDLKARTNANIAIAEELKKLSIEKLNQKTSAESWSALECIEHLNRYGDYYLPEINKQLKTANTVSPSTIFKSGVLGNYFAKLLQPKEKLNKMKTFKEMNASGSVLSIETIHKFIAQQLEMLEILEHSLTVNLKKTKTGVSISKVIKLRLGDTFRVVIYHNQRHLIQAQKAV